MPIYDEAEWYGVLNPKYIFKKMLSNDKNQTKSTLYTCSLVISSYTPCLVGRSTSEPFWNFSKVDSFMKV